MREFLGGVDNANGGNPVRGKLFWYMRKRRELLLLLVLEEADGDVMKSKSRALGPVQDSEQFTHSNSSSRKCRVWAQLGMRDMLRAYGKSLSSALIFLSTNVIAGSKVGRRFWEGKRRKFEKFLWELERNWLSKYSIISIKDPLRLQVHKFIVKFTKIWSASWEDRSRLDRESDLAVNQEREKRVSFMTDHDIYAKEGGDSVGSVERK